MYIYVFMLPYRSTRRDGMPLAIKTPSTPAKTSLNTSANIFTNTHVTIMGMPPSPRRNVMSFPIKTPSTLAKNSLNISANTFTNTHSTNTHFTNMEMSRGRIY